VALTISAGAREAIGQRALSILVEQGRGANFDADGYLAACRQAEAELYPETV
jgi:hypothetical protein